jgi:hypothetical protein
VDLLALNFTHTSQDRLDRLQWGFVLQTGQDYDLLTVPAPAGYSAYTCTSVTLVTPRKQCPGSLPGTVFAQNHRQGFPRKSGSLDISTPWHWLLFQKPECDQLLGLGLYNSYQLGLALMA